jgi:hypothetical protein
MLEWKWVGVLRYHVTIIDLPNQLKNTKFVFLYIINTQIKLGSNYMSIGDAHHYDNFLLIEITAETLPKKKSL